MLTGKVSIFMQEKNGEIWYEDLLKNGDHEKGVLKFRNGKYASFQTPFYKFTDYSCDSPYNILSAPDSTIFIGTNLGLIQYDPKIKVKYDQPFNTLIRNVFARDSLLFGGMANYPDNHNNIESNIIPYKFNDLVFHFTTTFYEDAEKNLFNFRLIGSDTTWSAWTKDRKKEYTNLPEGKYIFEVKSKNQYQEIGSTASYSFRILPPWYRTWLAYLGIYAVCCIGCLQPCTFPHPSIKGSQPGSGKSCRAENDPDSESKRQPRKTEPDRQRYHFIPFH